MGERENEDEQEEWKQEEMGERVNEDEQEEWQQEEVGEIERMKMYRRSGSRWKWEGYSGRGGVVTHNIEGWCPGQPKKLYSL